jgi:1-phosphofructokinase
MIVTLTANPSLDRTVNLSGPLERGAVQRADSVISQAGGKGVNISRACVAADLPSIAVLPAAKDDPFVLELLAAGIDCRPVEHEGDLRVNITITEPDGTTTKLNSPGPQATPRLLRELEEVLAHVPHGTLHGTSARRWRP